MTFRLHWFLLLLSTGAFAQDTLRVPVWSRPTVLKTNLLAPVSIFYERALTRRFTLRLSSRALSVPEGIVKKQSFINGTLEGKIYTARLTRLLSKPHPTGFFLNPYVKVRSLQIVDRVGINPDIYNEETIKSVGFGLTVGYQWVSSRGVVVEVFHGFGIMPTGLSNYRKLDYTGTITTDLTNEYLMRDLRSGVSVGYAF